MAKTIRQKTLAERALPGGREIELAFREEGDTPVPGILQLPAADALVPAVLILHGLFSRKEVLSESVGRALLRHGIASLSIDLPLHGSRDDPASAEAMRNPLKMIGHWRRSLAEARLAIAYLRARPEVDGKRIGAMGYSLGSQIAAATAASDPGIRALVIAAGGDLPEGTTLTAMARSLADPIKAVRALRGRPLLMVHGRSDQTMRPEQAQRLFDAASEPKEIRWVDAGHRLPDAAIEGVGEWLERQLV